MVAAVSQTDKVRMFTVERFPFDNQAIHFYTGLETFYKLIFLLDFLSPAAYALTQYQSSQPSISVKDQLICTLKLRQHKTDYELTLSFEIPVCEKSVANV